MSSFIERVIAEADEELRRLNSELASLGDSMDRALAVIKELQRRQQIASHAHAEVIRVLAAMTDGQQLPSEPVDVPVIDRRTGEAVELGPVEGVTPVEPEPRDPRSAEEAVAASEPHSNGHAHTEELESSRKSRKTPQRVSLERVRDVAVTLPDKFGTRDIASALGCSPSTARKYVEMLVKHKPPILEQHGTVGRGVRYSYIPPQNGRGPTTRPNHEREVMAKAGVGRQSVAQRRGISVPRTGKMIGPSGKPGRDKKLAEQGKRVKRHRIGS